jgi:hypothetical protein
LKLLVSSDCLKPGAIVLIDTKPFSVKNRNIVTVGVFSVKYSSFQETGNRVIYLEILNCKYDISMLL